MVRAETVGEEERVATKTDSKRALFRLSGLLVRLEELGLSLPVSSTSPWFLDSLPGTTTWEG